MAKTQVKEYIFKPGLGLLDNLYPEAVSVITDNKEFIQYEATAFIQNQVDTGVPGYVGYTFNTEKCRRDVGYVVDAYIFDLRYGGNQSTYDTIKYYWDQDVAQIDGSRIPEIDAHEFIRDLITDYILLNRQYTALNGIVSQSFANENLQAVANADAATVRIDELAGYTISVITTGLSELPEKSTGLGHIKIQGRYSLEDILLITNTTDNTIIYNFGDNQLGGNVVQNTNGGDSDFVTYKQITDAVTTIQLKQSTADQSADDSLQIFTEKTENGRSIQYTRPFDFGTDAIERTRMAVPLSMLDADFEYGLQPTKWAAIGVLRGYPSIYEIPGTDASVSTVATDASFGNTTEDFRYNVSVSGNADWIISGEDRNGLFGATPDPAITIREGDRVEFVNIAGSTHPFYIKTQAVTGTASGVSGVENNGGFGGDSIIWQTTLGDAGTYYYQCSIHSGQVGQIIVEPADSTTGVGQSEITITTVTPHGIPSGTPITVKALEDSVLGAARAEGSFVVTEVPDDFTLKYFAKAKVGTIPGQILSTTYTQLRQAGFYTGSDIGAPEINLISNGTEGSIVTELTVPSGASVIPFDGPSPSVGSPLVGNLNLGPDTQVTGVIDNSAGGGTYISADIDGDYVVGNTQITLTDATGIVPNLAFDRGDGKSTHIQSVLGNNIVLADPIVDNILGTTATYINVIGTNDTNNGSEVSLNISAAAGVYTVDAVNDAGTGYQTGDRLIVPGTQLNGGSPEHDFVLIVNSVTSDGAIDTYTTEGTAFDGTGTISGLTPTDATQGSGSPQFEIDLTDGVWSISPTPGDSSTGYSVGDVLSVTDYTYDVLPGAPVSYEIPDLQVTAVDGSGKITTIETAYTFTAPDANVGYQNVAYSTNTAAGAGAQFDVIRLGTAYIAAIPTTQGTNYLAGETFTVTGDNLGGATPANDLTITIDTVGPNGEVQDVTLTGTAANTDSFLTGSSNAVLANVFGTGLEITVALSAGTYSVSSIDSAGSGYVEGMILTIPGNQVFGDSPANDITVEIADVTTINTGDVQGVTLTGTANNGSGSFTNVEPQNQDPIGTGASFEVERLSTDGVGEYVARVESGGTDYRIGDRIILPGTSLGGVSPLNDVLVRVAGVTGGTINSVTSEYTDVPVAGSYDFISSLLISEPLEGEINVGTSIDYKALATLEAEFDYAHGLVPGNTFIVTIQSDNGTNNHKLAQGSFIVTDIPTSEKLRFQARTTGILTETDTIQGAVYPRPDSFFIHRPYDGGVQLGTGGPQHGAQAIRQSKKYIRYQSGKGIMYTTGALFAPSYDLRSVVADGVEVGSLITITTDDNDHGLQAGGVVRLSDIETPGYNSGPDTAVPPQFDYEVVEVLDERSFTVRAQRRLGDTEAVLGFDAQMSVVSWHGATVRSGIFDDQNGIFWEFDGTQISVVQRTGTKQITGTISLTVDSNYITGTNTKFRDQLKAGDRIIIKGMTHVISHVIDQTTMTVTPDWRGVVDITGAKANLVIDKKVKQEDFNIDRLDGTGPSGYDIDIAKMQMIGIQYSWYGAGFIDFMLRGADGNFVYAHRMRNSNVNTEAFMRSGNLPVRYEVTNEGPGAKLKTAMTDSQTFIELVDSSFFPDSGTLYIDNEIITFTANDKDLNRLTGCTRGTSYTNYQAGASRNYTAGPAATHEDRTGVILISQTITPLISHWGSAFITDGGFDEDRGYLFSYAETGVGVSTTRQTAFMIRLAPSVSNALVGDLGERELLNRAQLLLNGIEITSDDGTGGIVVEGILNPQNYPVDPDSVSWQELTSLAQGGQPSFAQIAPGGGINWTTNDTVTTATVTAQSNLTATASIRYSRDGGRYMYPTRTTWDASGATVGDFVTASSGGATFGGGIRIRRVQGPYTWGGTPYYQVELDSNFNGIVSGNVTVERRFTQDNRSFADVSDASYAAAGVTAGTNVASTGGSVTFPAGTIVSDVAQREFGGTEYYRISFNNTYSGTFTQGTGQIDVEFRQPPYAQPGETVFSFIANPGERSTLDLTPLKEITNTPLGGRGTFPNGPDVLAINVYKVTGNDLPANIILKWGEAQA